jgi:hypothetical protein
MVNKGEREYIEERWMLDNIGDAMVVNNAFRKRLQLKQARGCSVVMMLQIPLRPEETQD